MVILGISAHYHESAAAIVIDGVVKAASAEERFTRIKHDASFPDAAIDFCLKHAGVKPQDVDYVVFYEKPLVKFDRTLTIGVNEYPVGIDFFVRGMKQSLKKNLWIHSQMLSKFPLPSDRFLFVPHHLSHAAAAFYPSPFSKSAYLILDAAGEWSTGSFGRAAGNKLYPTAEMRFPHSIGLLYSAFTRYLGYEVNDGEYKVMGLAAYGKPRYAERVRKVFRQLPDSTIELNLSYFSFHQSGTRMYTQKFERLFHSCTPNDLAASVQKVTEEVILSMMKYVASQTREKSLVFGGGVALNSALNGLITKKTPFQHVSIYPASGDDGGAVGSALYVYHHILGNRKREKVSDVFLGSAFTQADCKKAIRSHRLKAVQCTDRQLVAAISSDLAHGKIIGWFEGRAEFGPRALGHRSILADPRHAEMKDSVNARIKFREEFRPFAPMVLKRHANRYFAVTEAGIAPYMLATFKAKKPAQAKAPAVVHVDRTSRIQIVDPDTYNGRVSKLLTAFYRKTGVPVLLNTSFNLKGEPIVNSPEDAIRTFLRSGLDILVLENMIVTK